MTAPNSYKHYMKQSVMTMSQGEQTIFIFDEAIKAVKHASFYMNNDRDDKRSGELTDKAVKLFRYLDDILDYSYDISVELHMIYDFCIRALIRSDIRKRSELLLPVIEIAEELRSAFASAVRNVHIK